MKFREALEKSFSITVEIPPPQGVNPQKHLKIAEKVRERVSAINVTDNQRGMARMSALAFCRLLVEAGCEPVLQLCCRDRNRLALESDLIGAVALGIKNVCIMTGDYTTLGNRPGAKPVFDLDPVQLIQLTAGMVDKKSPDKHPLFHVGAVVNPFYEPRELEILKTRKKIKAGSRFFQTQPFFDMQSLKKFMEKFGGLQAKFLIGVAPLKSVKMINFLNEKVLTTPVPKEIEQRMSIAADPAREGLLIAAEFINELRSRVDGVHIMPVGQVGCLPELLDMIGA